jgi:hypothetical protein
MNQTNHFFDLGYGWLCKHCSAADTEARHHPPPTTSNFFRAGEPEKDQMRSKELALASWTDASRSALTCPRCGIHETIHNG